MFRYAGVCVKEAEKGWCLASSRFDQGLKEPGSKVRGFLFLCVIECARVFLCVIECISVPPASRVRFQGSLKGFKSIMVRLRC